ncbi:ER membrane protein complex subunit 3 [Carex littledalei]|uniref:ER membrane protein complex subunit 3 n=1 Tax=Carex littledalei TaxID=544730 RepID=A0A833V7K0_9POAL|nr:ER membrane protein complex subunit 3 [Carex littledalei]
MADDLVLDTAIRNWVLVPLSVVMVLIGILRYFVSKLTRSSQNPDKKAIKEGQAVIRARNLRSGAHLIPSKSFRSRRIYFTNEENGPLYVPREEAQRAQAPMFQDPNMAMDMTKKNLPQSLTYAWVNFFFSGFVAAKIPFPLTPRFRAMLQYGIDLSTVDVSYVSSRSCSEESFYGTHNSTTASAIFPKMPKVFSFGCNETVLKVMYFEPFSSVKATDDAQKMMQMSGGAFGFNASQGLGVERDSLDIIQHEWALPKMEHRAKDVLKSLAKIL